jgi:DNA-binding response OmpR family regulator
MDKYSTKILIVDDAPDFCETLAWLLNDEGYSCRVAGNGQQAIDMLGKEKVHIILLDWKMPIMNGAVFLQKRSLRPELRRIPVLILSGALNVEKNVEHLNASVLQKPLDFAQLLGKVESMLAIPAPTLTIRARRHPHGIAYHE